MHNHQTVTVVRSGDLAITAKVNPVSKRLFGYCFREGRSVSDCTLFSIAENKMHQVKMRREKERKEQEQNRLKKWRNKIKHKAEA